jgi:site-specific recombinase XerD
MGYEPKGALFKTRHGKRFTRSGFVRIFMRIREQTGINVTAHALRRTFAILSLRAGMDAGHVKGLGGWESLDMLYYYAQLENIDLVNAHKAHSPIDNLDKLKS